jgi:hypothetical protein
MSITLVSTMSIRCGVAEYSRYLGQELRRQKIPLNYFANEISGKGNQDIRVYDDDKELLPLIRGFSVPGWSGEVKYDRDQLWRMFWPGGIVHIQHQAFLYDKRWFFQFLVDAKEAKSKIIFTLHDSNINSDALAYADGLVLHSQEMKMELGLPMIVKPIAIIPSGVPYHQPIVTSFGLGRSNAEMITQACTQLGIKYEPMHWGNWVSQDELMKRIKQYDATVLLYPPDNAVVSSSSVKVALAAYRPVITSDTTWFKDLEDGLVTKCQYSVESLVEALKKVFSKQDTLHKMSWEESARKHIEFYNMIERM